jgi:S-DNA-T family DNA segregation ATPase FtsK/SpoIIIE
MRSLLDHQADGIEYTLHSHGLGASVVGGNISPRLIQFHIKLEGGAKFNRVAALAEELAVALNVHHCRITREGALVKIEVPRPDPVAVRLFPLMRNLPGTIPENAPVLGLDENGVPLLIRFSSPDIAHVFVCGGSGSGKTILTRSMIASIALQNPPERLRLLLIDPKGRGYRQFNGLPNLICPVVTDPLDALHRLRWAVRHLEKRQEQGVDSPELVIFIDELADLMALNGREVEQVFLRLLEEGCEVGVHLVACTQKILPNIATIARMEWPTRVVGRVASQEEAWLASSRPNSGAERLMGQGDFLLYTKEEARLQAAYISPEEMEQTVIHLGGVPGEPIAKPSRSNPAKPATARAQSQRQYYQTPSYSDETEDEQEQEQPKPKTRRPERTFRQSAATTHQEQDPGAMGVAERLARYQESIRQRRGDYTEAEDEEEYQYYNPARAQREPEVSRPSRKGDVWDEEEQQRPIRAPQPPQRQPSRSSGGDNNVSNFMTNAKKTLFNNSKISS